MSKHFPAFPGKYSFVPIRYEIHDNAENSEHKQHGCYKFINKATLAIGDS